MPSTASRSAADSSTLAPGHRAALDWLERGPKKLFIGGKWVDALSGKTFKTLDPATEKVLGTIAEADSADIDAAVVAARRALEAPSWSAITPHQRAQYLYRIAELVDQNAEELAYLETLDMGAPISSTPGRVASTAETFRYFAGWPTKLHGTTNPSDPSRFIYTLREPMGVCALINAWNFPLGMAASKLGPALACGNTAILKPAEQSPLATIRLGELIEEAGVPPGVVNIVPGFGITAGAAMAAHPGIDKIAFTGSTGVGRHILSASAGNMKKVTVELGGKSPNIIFADADLDRAAQTAALAFCRNTGQVCSAGTRLLVHRSIYDEVVERVSRKAAAYRVGSPLAAETEIGPLISDKQLERVLGFVDAGLEDGAKLALGGKRIGTTGYFIEPTVFSHASNGMRIAQEEIFGPVLSVIAFDSEQEAVQIGNDTPYGLAAAVWTRDMGTAHRVARALKSGRVWINTYAESDPVMPMGGYKQSGYGREQGSEAIESYSQTKSVLTRF